MNDDLGETMTRVDIVWEALRWPGVEHVVFHDLAADSWSADGTVVAALDTGPVTATYDIKVNGPTCRFRARLLSPRGERSISLTRDAPGSWYDHSGARIARLAGCTDVDFAITPLTNTMPIRRLSLTPGESADIEVAYLSVPGFRLTRATQRYTCVAPGEYLYRSGRFRAEVSADAGGRVTTYSDLWVRR
jgi:hypothetical protein